MSSSEQSTSRPGHKNGKQNNNTDTVVGQPTTLIVSPWSDKYLGPCVGIALEFDSGPDNDRYRRRRWMPIPLRQALELLGKLEAHKGEMARDLQSYEDRAKAHEARAKELEILEAYRRGDLVPADQVQKVADATLVRHGGVTPMPEPVVGEAVEVEVVEPRSRSSRKRKKTSPKVIAEGILSKTYREAIAEVENCSSKRVLRAALSAETDGKGRKTVLQAIQDRLDRQDMVLDLDGLADVGFTVRL